MTSALASFVGSKLQSAKFQLESMFEKAVNQTDAAWYINNCETISFVNEDLTVSSGGWKITPGRWQTELRPIVALCK